MEAKKVRPLFALNRLTSEAELQLWVKHLNPVWKSPIDEMKRALAACYAEAEARGILQGSGTAAGMLDFLLKMSPYNQAETSVLAFRVDGFSSSHLRAFPFVP